MLHDSVAKKQRYNQNRNNKPNAESGIKFSDDNLKRVVDSHTQKSWKILLIIFDSFENEARINLLQKESGS